MVEIILGIALMVLAVAIVILVLMQQGKDKKLSGAIAGGADTFFGKSKANDQGKFLSAITTVISIVFVGLVVAMYLFI
jgi:preprotein translocase subunit SecG